VARANRVVIHNDDHDGLQINTISDEKRPLSNLF